MRLYHPPLFILVFLGLLVACTPVQAPQVDIQVTVHKSDESQVVTLSQGSTAEDAINTTGITLGDLDRVEPPLYTVMTDGGKVQVIQVSEEFDIEQVVLPYESRTIRNEALPEGERRLVQAGVNGLQEITYRRVYEDNVEISRNPVKSIIVQEAVPEIVMVGSQNAYSPVRIPGQIVYLASGNGWIIDGVSGERRPVITTGDLDGRVFSLSPDGEWLLYTRSAEDTEDINHLWVTRIDDPDTAIDLQAKNIVHFADWVPNEVLQVGYSTVEPRSSAPGWQANNDLNLVSFSPTGWVSDPELVVDANAGGVYGWWGTSYEWSPDGEQLAFVRPDGAGLVNFEEGLLQKVIDITPFQTLGDWAWVSSIKWSPDGTTFYIVDHLLPTDGSAPEASQNFSVSAIPLEVGTNVQLVSQAGMFASPVPSPSISLDSGEKASVVAYLQAVFPNQSETSPYQLVMMDRDGSNLQVLFPENGAPGLDPQQLVWTPELVQEEGSYDLAMIYQGNLWLIDVQSASSRQLTGDGLIKRIDWK